MMPIALVCLFSWRGHMGVSGAGIAGTWAGFAAHPVSAIIFSVLALGELVGDKLPKTPNRTAIFPLLARIGFGGLVGSIGATALSGAWIEGAILGGGAAAVGTFVTYHTRKYLVEQMGWNKLLTALLEDGVVIGLSVLMLGIVTG